MSSPDLHAFIGDLHLSHANVLKHDKRPYNNISEHDRDLTRMCAGLGRPNATLWLVGDVAMTKEALVTFLDEVRPHWGKLILIRGNHDDRVAWRYRDLFDEAHESRYLRVSPEVKVYISHYAHRVWRNSHHGAFHLHGHSHGALPRVGRSMDVGAPCIGYKPIFLNECVEQLKDAASVNHHPEERVPKEFEAAMVELDSAKAQAPAAPTGVLEPVDVRAVAVSQNLNSFGLKGIVVMARDGRAWELGVSIQNLTFGTMPIVGQPYKAMVDEAGMIQQGSLPFSFEIPRAMGVAPPSVVKEVWG